MTRSAGSCGRCLTEAEKRYRYRATALAALVLALFYPLDLTYGGWRAAAAVAARSTWIASLLLLLLSARQGQRRIVAGMERITALVSGLATAIIVAAAGGTADPFFGYMYAIPFAMSVLLPGIPAVPLMAGAGVILGGIALFVREAAAFQVVLVWAVITGAATAAAAAGTAAYARLRAAELAALRDRAEADAATARAAHMADSVRLAAAVAHEINNPLSAVLANARWLREVTDDEAVRAATEELAACAVRIRDSVADLQAAVRECPDRPGCDLGIVVSAAVAAVRETFPKLDVAVSGVLRPPRVAVDARPLLRILRAMIADAAAGPPGATHPGEVTLKLGVTGAFATVHLRQAAKGGGSPPVLLASVPLSAEALRRQGAVLAMERGEEPGEATVLRLPIAGPTQA